MLEYDRIDISEGIDINETNALREGQYFLHLCLCMQFVDNCACMDNL